MALGLYKPGQGYWMRVLTAAMVGTLFLALAMWVAGQAKRVAATLPVTSYSIAVREAAGLPAPGTRVTLLGEPTSSAPAPVIGSATVESLDPGNKIIVVRGVDITNSNYEIRATKSLAADAVSGAGYTSELTEFPAPRAVVEPILVEGIAASLVLIIGAILTYWLCATRPKTVDFLINTDMEMKKVNWSTRKDIIGSTWVVIGSSFLIAAFIFVADVLMQRLFKLIGVLQG